MPYKRTKRKKFVSAVALATFTYASVIFTSGMLLGYVLTKKFYKKYVENGFLQSMYIDVKGYKIHLHHWIMGVLVILLLISIGWESQIPKFFWGILAGIIAHDIYDFDDWHKVVIKEKAI